VPDALEPSRPSSPPRAPERAPERAPQRDRSTGVSLRLQAVALAIAVVAVVVVAHGLFTHRAVTRAVEASSRATIEAAATRAALELALPMRRWDPDAVSQIVERTMTDGAISSVTIVDERGEVIVRRLRADAASREASRLLALPARAEPLRQAAPVVHAGERLGWSCRTPVWSSDAPSRLLGFVTVAGHDEPVRGASAVLPGAAIVAGGASLLLAGPIAAWGAARLVRPVRRVARAAAELEAGRRPKTLSEGGPRETRILIGAFNRMSESLHGALTELEAGKAQLERKVEERTRQLALVNEMLQEQVRSKNEFLRSVSHDLGAPLRNIAGMARLVLDAHGAELPDTARHALDRIGANVRIEAEMLAELLELSRTTARAERLERLDVGAVARELAQSIADDARRQRVEIVVAPDLPVLEVDRTDLWMLLQNLVDNAIKYMGDAAERRVVVAPLLDAPAFGFVVADTGPGIPERERERIFRAFQRASTAGEAAGRGVGLAVVRSIAERWGGDVRAVGPPEGGTRFEVRLAPSRASHAGSGGACRPHDRSRPHNPPPGRQAAA